MAQDAPVNGFVDNTVTEKGEKASSKVNKWLSLQLRQDEIPRSVKLARNDFSFAFVTGEILKKFVKSQS